MIATEAAAEGINLQFCSLIVNYDLPWNPQRIEQRIGRCHRYGQKYDVVVINFLNKSNAADIRVYELLDQKFQLFNGVFGASDEVLGSIGNGVDFEKRISQIYTECRTTEEIEQAFDQLQSELQDQISEKMLKARSTLLENFDESVKEKLRDNLATSQKNLNHFQEKLWLLLNHSLKDKATINENDYTIDLHKSGNLNGRYVMPSIENRLHQNYIPLRIGHPLVKQVLDKYKTIDLSTVIVEFNYTDGLEGRVTLLEELVGKTGVMEVMKISIDSFEEEDHIVVACMTDDGQWVYKEIAERLLLLPAKVIGKGKISTDKATCLSKRMEDLKANILSENGERNRNFFDEEMDKLDNWADDMKLTLEREIADLDKEIRLRKSEAKKMSRLEEKVSAQRAIKEMEKKRMEKRQNLYEAQDDIDSKKEDLLEKVEHMLKQNVTTESLFRIEWTVI